MTGATSGRWPGLRRLLVALLVSVLTTPRLIAAAHADPPLPTWPLGEPIGANDWSCRPTAGRPTPVVIV